MKVALFRISQKYIFYDFFIFQVIPIEGNFLVNEEKQKTFEEILPEVLIAKEMSQLRVGDIFKRFFVFYSFLAGPSARIQTRR